MGEGIDIVEKCYRGSEI